MLKSLAEGKERMSGYKQAFYGSSAELGRWCYCIVYCTLCRFLASQGTTVVAGQQLRTTRALSAKRPSIFHYHFQLILPDTLANFPKKSVKVATSLKVFRAMLKV
jgi:hypothetical protein